jgi:IS1 family transposase
LAFHFGTREHSNLDELLALLKPFNISVVYAGNNFAYKTRITGSEMVTGKQNTQTIDSKETSFVTDMVLPFSEERDTFFQGSVPT